MMFSFRFLRYYLYYFTNFSQGTALSSERSKFFSVPYIPYMHVKNSARLSRSNVVAHSRTNGMKNTRDSVKGHSDGFA